MGKGIEIRVKDVDPVAVSKIDAEAKSKNMSRSEYLRTVLESFAIADELREQHERDIRQTNSIASVLEENIEVMHAVLESLNDLNTYLARKNI